MKRILSMLMAAVLVFGMVPTGALAETFDIENFVGVVLTVADSSLSVELYKGITSQKTLMIPVHTEANAYYYEVVGGASYCYIVKPTSGTKYYTVRQNFYLTAEDAQKKLIWDVTPQERIEDGWNPKEIWSYSDAVMENAFPSSPELWPAYANLLDVPALSKSRPAHQMTTQEEMMDYISALDDAQDDMYVLTLGQSGGPADSVLDIPAVFFTKTDLSGADTWEEAAALVRANGNLTALYQAQVHGNEPAAGEAALAMLKAFDGSYGAGLLDNMNICVLPRVNVYGASKASRYVYVDGKDVDPNRDFVKLRSAEILLRTQLFLALEPEICFDNHEYQLRVTNSYVDIHDVKLNAVYTTNSNAAFRDMALTLAEQAFGRAAENNLGYGWYSDCINGYNPSVGTTNVAMRGCLSFLTETNGIMGGNQQLERRMMSHISVVTGILDYVNANTAAVQKVVDDQRKDTVQRGKTYEESDIIALKTSGIDRPDLYINGKQVSAGAGKITDKTFTAEAFDGIERSRTAPTAYVIPAGEPWAEAVVENLRRNGVRSTKLPAGAVVQLQQYTGTTTEAALTEEKAVSFPQGAYVMTMAQENGYILAMRMEPDVDDGATNTATFAQEGVLNAENGVFPLYRYVQNLNSDDFIDYVIAPAAPTGLSVQSVTAIGGTGSITGLDAAKTYEYRTETAEEYTAVAPGSTEIADLPLGTYLVRYVATQEEIASVDTELAVGYALSKYAVYVDSANGTKTGDAYTQQTAASTYTIAKGQLDELMKYAPAGTTGEIHLIGTYSMTKSSSGYLSLQEHDYPLLITGGTLIYTDNANSQKYLRMGGDTTFDNITIKPGSNSSAYFLCGDGHKLTIGEHVVSQPNGAYYFNIMGGLGEYSNNQYAAQGDVTILSGTWRYVYAGGYVSSITGDARIKASNCSVARISGTHNGHLNGNLYMELDNITVRGGELHGGNYQKNDVAGNVTMVLGEGIDAADVYAGSRTGGNVGGMVTIVANGVDLSNTTIHGKPYNADGTIGGLKLVLNNGQMTDVAESFITRDGVQVVLGCDQTEAFTLPYAIDLDLNGHSVAAINTNGKTLTVKDSATDDYVGEIYGTIPATVIYKAAEGYLPITEGDKVSFHKYALEITQVTLKTAQAGLNYSCFLAGDQKVKAQVAEFGIAMWLHAPITQEQILADTQNKIHVWRSADTWQTGKAGQTLTGCAVVGVMKDGKGDTANAQRAEMEIYGTAYLRFKDGSFLMSKAEGRTLRAVIEEVDAAYYDTLTPEQLEALQTLYTDFAGVMENWVLSNIQKAAS